MEDFVVLPALPLDNLDILPNTSTSIEVDEEKSVATLRYAMENRKRTVLVLKDGNGGYKQYGVLVDMAKFMRVNDSAVRVMLEGVHVMEICDVSEEHGRYSVACILREEGEENIDKEIVDSYKNVLIKYLGELEKYTGRELPKHVMKGVRETEELRLLVNIVGMVLSPMHDKYQLIEPASAEECADKLCEFLAYDVEVAKHINRVESKVQQNISRMNKEYYLREHIKAMQEELDGEEEDEFSDKINALTAGDDVKSKLFKEAERLKRMNDSAPEAAIIRNYLDWVCELPWGKLTEDSEDLKGVMRVLNEDHYGIENVKKRIVEFLAVRMLTKGKSRGTSICLVGPPGVGKTSIARSIAKALGKDFVQLTLGGVHDEAEIRGHRKTYIGAMPGRIMSSLAKSQSDNPVFLLDEVDKITKDMRGDPQSALLEVLDPNQNTMFRDNYLEIPYDISNVMFIVTANDLSTLDKPLLDRLEVIQMDGYTPEEKLAIARKYLVKKQSEAHGLTEADICVTDGAINEIIEGYTNESGVRELERKIASLCRKVAYNKVIGKNKRHIVRANNVAKYLGVRINPDEIKTVKGEVGKATGLAWNGLGGSTLDIEVAIMPGSGDVKLTGKLGEVMKESAMTALSVIRKRTEKIGYDAEFYKNHDIHVHVPAGATPKDGPSAGITLATAIMSAVLNKPVKDELAMTGEISLSGNVMVIGGLKEKSLAAARRGVKTILLPRENERDIDELPKSVRESIRFIPVDNIDQVLQEAVSGYAD